MLLEPIKMKGNTKTIVQFFHKSSYCLTDLLRLNIFTNIVLGKKIRAETFLLCWPLADQ